MTPVSRLPGPAALDLTHALPKDGHERVGHGRGPQVSDVYEWAGKLGSNELAL
jgi:hypothetical protein